MFCEVLQFFYFIFYSGACPDGNRNGPFANFDMERILHQACRENDVALTQMLVNAGADVELKNPAGRTAIDLCPEDSESWKIIHSRKNRPLNLTHICRNLIAKCLYKRRKGEGAGVEPFGDRLDSLGLLPYEVMMLMKYNK